MKRRIYTIMFALLFSVSISINVFADSVNEKKSELNKVNESIEDIKDEIEEVKEDKEQVLDELKSINEEVDKLTAELRRNNNEISSVENQISQIRAELKKQEEEYSAYQVYFDKRMRAMYVNGSQGYLDVIFSAKSPTDFMTRFINLKMIIEYDKSVLEEMKIKQNEIKDKKKVLDKKKNDLVSLRSSLSSKKTQLNIANQRKNAYYEELNNDIAKLEKALDEEIQESKNLEKEIQKIIERMAKENNNSSYSGTRGPILKRSEASYGPTLTSPFGMRFHPILKKYRMHNGVDYGAPSGTPIYAMSDGKVIISAYSNGYGNYVVIDHGGGLSTLYSHNSVNLVSAGTTVKKGQAIAKIGQTGYATGPHLHFEVRKNGSPINPSPYVIIGQ